MKKVCLLMVTLLGILFVACNSIDSQISQYEKACEAGDYQKATKIAAEIAKHPDKMTLERTKRITDANIKLAEKITGDTYESAKEFSNDAYESAKEALNGKSSAEVDAMLNKLENMLNKFEKMDDLSDEYDEMEDKILNLMDEIDDCNLTPAQEKKYDKLDNRFDRH